MAEEAQFKTRIAKGQDGDMFVMFWCPGCEEYHGPRVESALGRGVWTWNGDRVRPTFQPSILVRGTKRLTDAEHARIMRGEAFEPVSTVCHSFVTDGRIQFLGDCTHALVGETVDLPKDEE
jgi:hypothetical protein